MTLTVKEDDDPFIYNSLKVCGNLTDENFKELSLRCRQALNKENLDYEDARAIKELAPIIIDGPPSQLNYPYFKHVWEAKEPLIKMLADSMPKLSSEAAIELNEAMDEWFKRLF